MVVVPGLDPFLAADCAERTATACGAGITRLDGLGHWWPLQDPARGADMLGRFWSSL